MSSVRWLLWISLALLVLTGCSFQAGQLVDADQTTRHDELTLPLEPGQPLGQTFVARHGGLAGIEFFLLPGDGPLPTLSLYLRQEPGGPKDLAVTSLTLSDDAEPGVYRFAFPPRAGSHGEYYYAFLEASEPGIAVALADGETYLDGAAYRSHRPLDAQTSFRLVYAPAYAVLDLVKAGLAGMGWLMIAGLLFVVPGWAMLAWFLPDGRRLAWPEILGLSAGLSLATYPILILWTHLAGLDLGPGYAWLPVIAGVIALGWRFRGWRPQHGWAALAQWRRSDALLPDLTLLIVLGLVFSVRLLVTRSLDTPLWGDGFQHTMIAQLLVDHSGLFSSWAPYADLQTFTYHFGFHSAVAAWQWLTSSPVLEATVWIGQLLNALAVVALYPLASRITGSRWGGVWAVLLAGLLSPMPMLYVNWGRYTQLAGQAILPAAAWLAWEAVEVPERRWGLLALAMLAGGGLALTHYRVLLFYAVFGLALLLTRLRQGAWRETLLRLGLAGAGAGLLFLPWFLNVFGAELARILGQQLTTLPSRTDPFVFEYNAVGSLDSYLAPVWWLALALGLGVGLWQRQRSVLLVGLWWFLVLLATNPAWLSLPGTGVISNFALFIAAYVPAGLLSGVLVVGVVRTVAHHRLVPLLVALGMIGLGLWAVQDRLGDLQPAAHTLATRPDVRAGAWIRENTPPEGRFLINSFSAYGDSLVAGSDGGWWLSLLAGRQPTVPPLNYSSERGPSPQYRDQVNELTRMVHAWRPDDPRVRARLCKEGVTHVYVGQRQGRVNYAGESMIRPEELNQSTHYEAIYHEDRVWIYALECP